MTKVKNITKNKQHYNSNHKIKDINAVLKIQKYILDKLETYHIKKYHDNRKRKDQLTIAEKLNIKADRIIRERDCTPKPTNIRNTTIAVYVDNIPNNYVKVIQNHCGTTDARKFMKDKCKWIQTTIDDIDWEMYSNFVQNQTYARKKIITKFIHRWLVPGLKNEQEIGCPYCEIKEETIDHDHFLSCEMSFESKGYCMNIITNKLEKMKTPPYIIEGTTTEISSFYNSEKK